MKSIPDEARTSRISGGMRRVPDTFLFPFMLLCGSAPVMAHHSYAMFERTKTIVVRGTLAQLEWKNPHSFVWVYVEKPSRPGQYDLFAFEASSINRMVRYGWSKDAVKAGDKVTVQYFPLKDGRTGGYLVRVVRSDGSELRGDPQTLLDVAGALNKPLPGAKP